MALRNSVLNALFTADGDGGALVPVYKPGGRGGGGGGGGGARRGGPLTNPSGDGGGEGSDCVARYSE